MSRNEEQTRKLDVQLAHGLAWTAGAKWATQAFTWASLLIVARALSPADYGINEMAGVFVSLTYILAEFGVGTAVLHMPELKRHSLAQLNTFSCVVCSAAYLVSLLITSQIANFFRTPQLNAVLIVANITFVITGFQSVPYGLLQRDMDYRRLALAEVAQLLIQSSVQVILALLGYGYWSLVIGTVVGKASGAVLVSWWKPMSFAWPRWKDIQAPIEMGRQAAIGRVAWAAYAQSDGIVIGRVLGDSTLGVYRMAMYLASAPADKVGQLLMRAATPLFANVKDDHVMVRRYYVILMEGLSMVVMPLMLGLIVVADLVVPVVLGKQWTGAVGPLRWLAFFMIVRTLGTLTEQVLVSQRMTRFTMRMSLFNLVIMPVTFVVAAHWLGTTGVAAGWVALAPLTIVPLVVVLLRTVDLAFSELVSALFPSVLSSAGMCVAVLLVRQWLAPAALSDRTGLAVTVIAGGLVYAAIVMGFFRERVFRYVRFLQAMRKGKQSVVAEVA